MSPQIIPTAEPFCIPGGTTGCLLVHGFTGAPKEMRWMGDYLAKQGYSVLAPRLAGHATQIEDMNRVLWQDWLVSIEDGWNLLQGMTERIFIAGLSLGGVLSLLFASRFPVTGVIAMSTPYELPHDPRLHFLKWMHRFIPTVEKDPADWHDPEPAKDHIDYPVYPTRAIIELKAVVNEMQAALPNITAPTLLIHSQNDKGVPPTNMEKIYAALGTNAKERVWIEDSGHVIIRDREREIVFQAVNRFIHKVCKGSK
jgi:carboxylesterase